MNAQTLNRSRRLQRGIGVVDLMVAMAVSLLLLVGLLQAYLGTKQVYRVEESTARLMENGSVAIALLSRSVRRGGYWECSGWDTNNLKNHLGTNQRGLHGTNGTSNAPDTLRTLRSVDGTALDVQAAVTLPATITVPSGHGLQAGSLVVINDCLKGDIFDLDSVTAGPSRRSWKGWRTCKYFTAKTWTVMVLSTATSPPL
jgi:type IV pilus assembly protein PilW